MTRGIFCLLLVMSRLSAMAQPASCLLGKPYTPQSGVYLGLLHQHQGMYGHVFSYQGLEAGYGYSSGLTVGGYVASFVGSMPARLASGQGNVFLCQTGLSAGYAWPMRSKVHGGLSLRGGVYRIWAAPDPGWIPGHHPIFFAESGLTSLSQVFLGCALLPWLHARLGLGYALYLPPHSAESSDSQLNSTVFDFSLRVGPLLH